MKSTIVAIVLLGVSAIVQANKYQAPNHYGPHRNAFSDSKTKCSGHQCQQGSNPVYNPILIKPTVYGGQGLYNYHGYARVPSKGYSNKFCNGYNCKSILTSVKVIVLDNLDEAKPYNAPAPALAPSTPNLGTHKLAPPSAYSTNIPINNYNLGAPNTYNTLPKNVHSPRKSAYNSLKSGQRAGCAKPYGRRPRALRTAGYRVPRQTHKQGARGIY